MVVLGGGGGVGGVKGGFGGPFDHAVTAKSVVKL